MEKDLGNSALWDIEQQCNNSRIMKFYDYVDEEGERHIFAPKEMIEHNEKITKSKWSAITKVSVITQE